MNLPILDYKTDKAGGRYEYSLMFLEDFDIKIILGSLQKEYSNMLRLIDETTDESIKTELEKQKLNIVKLVLIIEKYEG